MFQVVEKSKQTIQVNICSPKSCR